MADVVEALIFDLLEWVAKGEKSYEEVMEPWRTSCPKLPVWEDANDRGLIAQEQVRGRRVVKITAAGMDFLEQRKQDASEQQVPRRQNVPRSGPQR